MDVPCGGERGRKKNEKGKRDCLELRKGGKKRGPNAVFRNIVK